jgi:hypothetical protein
MKIDKPLYLPEFIRLQGGKPTKHTVQRVRRFLRRTEERLSVTLLIQEYTGGPYYTTLALLRRWLPEFFDQDEHSHDIDEIKKVLATLEGRQTALKQRLKALSSDPRRMAVSRGGHRLVFKKSGRLVAAASHVGQPCL